ncbi:Tat proofreading chaperone FdhE [Sphaerotilus hippei]|uniref:Tat proofreading chaperone FdhE n=1 Tax=Sphaerotilus hippei TaxID=744406 RepID=A0A318GZV5_9BURK|nr:formate dehydrogenase accessory protein FdhE [Sphaerotilus hippei]PXW95782.1 Tat proofreading chaperone FdhE [Sphaerotilus hippei]
MIALTTDPFGGAPNPASVLSSSLSPPGVLRPRAGLLAARAARLRHLATGHELAPWLDLLSGLCGLQQTLLDHAGPAWAPGQAPDGAEPPLHAGHPGWPERLLPLHRALLAAMPDRQGDAAFSAQRQAARDLPDAALIEQARGLLDLARGRPLQRPGQAGDVWLAASLQVLWIQAARHLATVPQRPADASTCPCCGSLPVAGIVLTGDGKAGSRYLECSLCATRWNAVRARCTLCDSPHEVEYLGLEGHHPAVLAEACGDCGGYLKTLFQDKDPDVDPVADDLASLRLDVATGEAGHGRAGVNLFLLEAEALGS